MNCRTCGIGKYMRKLSSAVMMLLLFATASFGTDQKNGSDLLFKLEADFAKAVAEHGHAAFVSYFAEDGVELDDGGDIATRTDIGKQPAWPEGTSLSWTPVRGDMAASGDLGYTYGNYIFKSKNKEGKIVSSYGKYMSVWKKQKDGSWKVAVDMGNSSPEPK
jgi:ketosteroid isomerase-like protein